MTKIISQFSPLVNVAADWLIVGVWENRLLDKAVSDLDTQMGGALTRLIQRGDVTGKARELTPLLQTSGLEAQRVLIVGLGKQDKANAEQILSAAQAASRFITSKAYRRIAMTLPADVPGLDAATVASLIAVGLAHGCEGPGLHKSTRDRFLPEEIVIVASPGATETNIAQAVRRAEIEARSVSLARELVNMPPCDLYPETFAARAAEEAAKVGVECTILDEKQLAAERMNALLAVARGSDRPPRLVVLSYRGVRSDPIHRVGGDRMNAVNTSAELIGLVGKGVTFDSGGLSLKTNEQMLDMKCDMAGAAAVFGATLACAELKLPVNILGVLALVENLPSGKAMKLGDVLHARNGKTIEVLNTDAEGRLILADALTWAVDQKATRLVDLATLTGACMVALGTDVAGLMTNDERWSEQVLNATKAAGEKAWPLPMFPAYSEMIKSDVADIKNTGGVRWAGAITAAKFLEEFVAGVPWVHLDIAGPAWAEHENAVRDSGGTGCFVRTLVQLLSDLRS